MLNARLGRTNRELPVVVVGTWAHGGPKRAGKRDVGWSGHDDDLARSALIAAYEHGLVHWDTADAYGDGQSESLIGSLWKTVPRDEIFLATKVGWVAGDGPHPYHPDLIRRQIERSLRSLSVDRVDLYYFHHCDFGPEDAYLEGGVETFRELQAEGKVRFIGLSDWDSGKVAARAPRVQPDVVQVYRNVIDDRYASSGLQQWVEANDAGVAFFSPLRHGLLLGKHEHPPEFGPGDHRKGIPEFGDPDALARLRRCRAEIEARFGNRAEPVLDALVGVLLEDSESSCVLVGLRNPDQAAAASAVSGELNHADAEWVRELYRSSI